MRLAAVLFVIPLMIAADAAPLTVAPKPSASNSKTHESTHTLVRSDVLENLNRSDLTLPRCEQSLSEAQYNLQTAKNDLRKMQATALEYSSAIATLKAQKDILTRHIQKLESMTCPEANISEQIVRTWEEVDGVAGIGLGYGLGVGTCVGMAWVFNQPDFGGNP